MFQAVSPAVAESVSGCGIKIIGLDLYDQRVKALLEGKLTELQAFTVVETLIGIYDGSEI